MANIGGFLRDFVPRGTYGTVVHVPLWVGSVTVMFEVRKWLGIRAVLVNAYMDEIAHA